jgi:hypothetical protein
MLLFIVQKFLADINELTLSDLSIEMSKRCERDLFIAETQSKG